MRAWNTVRADCQRARRQGTTNIPEQRPTAKRLLRLGLAVLPPVSLLHVAGGIGAPVARDAGQAPAARERGVGDAGAERASVVDAADIAIDSDGRTAGACLGPDRARPDAVGDLDGRGCPRGSGHCGVYLSGWPAICRGRGSRSWYATSDGAASAQFSANDAAVGPGRQKPALPTQWRANNNK